MDYKHNCASCDKGYHSKQALLQHLKVHQGQAPIKDHTCPDCQEVFNLVKTMREHRAVHRGPYPCPVKGCPAFFSLPKRRNRHLRECHGFDAKRFYFLFVLSRPLESDHVAWTESRLIVETPGWSLAYVLLYIKLLIVFLPARHATLQATGRLLLISM